MVLRTLAQRMYDDLYNSGKDGLLTKFTKFTTDHNAREQERDKTIEHRHSENSSRLAVISNQLAAANLTVVKGTAHDSRRVLAWTIAGVMVAILSLIGCVVGIMVAIKLAHGASLPNILSSAEPSLAQTLSRLPSMR